MVAWSVLETVIQTAIMKELGITPAKAVITTGKLQFQPRVQLLINLLKLKDTPDRDAIKLLQKTEGFAHRNTIVHGIIIIGDPSKLTFIKYDGGASIKQIFTPETMEKHILGLNERTEKLQELLNVSDEEIQLIGDATLNFSKNLKA
jgi:hypothetical protein